MDRDKSKSHDPATKIAACKAESMKEGKPPSAKASYMLASTDNKWHMNEEKFLFFRREANL